MENDKREIFDSVAQRLKIEGFNVVNRDETRPWGGFFVIDEAQAQQFADTYFDGLDVEGLKIGGKLSPKILIVAPNTRLSWNITTAELKFGKWLQEQLVSKPAKQMKKVKLKSTHRKIKLNYNKASVIA